MHMLSYLVLIDYGLIVSKNSLLRPCDDENKELPSHARKGKGRSYPNKKNEGKRSSLVKKNDISKIRCFS